VEEDGLIAAGRSKRDIEDAIGLADGCFGGFHEGLIHR
jgi:hypothetical protein